MVDHRQALALALKRATKATFERYKAENPEATRLDVKADVWVFSKKPKGYSKHRYEIVKMFLDSNMYLKQTNAQITKSLSEKYAPYEIPGNVMTRDIPSQARKKIDEMLKAAGKDIDLKIYNTLSKIKGALLGKSIAASSDRRYDTAIAFTDTAVVIGNRTFPVTIHEKGYPRIRLTKEWLRGDVLEAMVKAGK